MRTIKQATVVRFLGTTLQGKDAQKYFAHPRNALVEEWKARVGNLRFCNEYSCKSSSTADALESIIDDAYSTLSALRQVEYDLRDIERQEAEEAQGKTI